MSSAFRPFQHPTKLELKFITLSQPSTGIKEDKKPVNIEQNVHTYQTGLCIDPSLFNYQHHYLKDIQNYFPKIQIDHILYCPQVSFEDGNIPTTNFLSYTQARSLSASQFCTVFLNNYAYEAYTKKNQQLLGILLQKGDNYVGFLGYIPKQFLLLDVLQALSTFYEITLSLHWQIQTQFTDQPLTLDCLSQTKIDSVSGSYLRVFSTNYMENEVKNQFIISEPIPEERMESFNMDSIQTNVALSEPFWRSASEIQTCIQTKKVNKNMLISLKSGEEVQKMRAKAFCQIINPIIGVPQHSQNQISLNLGRICKQLTTLFKV